MKIRDGKLPTGKGQFIWLLHRLVQQYGSVEQLVQNMISEGYQWASVKIQEGILAFRGYKTNGYPQQVLLKEFVEACVKHGLEFHAWGYIYGRSPYTGRSLVNQEASMTLQMIAKYRPLSYIINDENKSNLYKTRVSHADSYIRQVKSGMAITGDSIPDIPLGMSSFRFPEYHRKIPYAGYAPYLDFWAPQVYWQKDTRSYGASDQLYKSISQHQKIRDLPFVPAGTIYPEGKWWPTAAQLEDFNETCKQLENVIGVNYWEYYYPRYYGKTTLITELTDFDWKTKQAEPQPDPEPEKPFDCEKRVEDLEKRVNELEKKIE